MPIKLNCKNYLANFSLAFLIICSFDNRRNINTISLNWCLKFISLVCSFYTDYIEGVRLKITNSFLWKYE